MKNILYLTLLILLAGCSSSGEKEKTKILPPPHTETFTLSKESLYTSLKIPAEITAYREVDLYAKVNSYVKTLTVDVGSPVKKGQLLATLEAPELLSQMAAAESKYKAQQAMFTQSDATYQRVLAVSRTPGTVSMTSVICLMIFRSRPSLKLGTHSSNFIAVISY